MTKKKSPSGKQVLKKISAQFERITKKKKSARQAPRPFLYPPRFRGEVGQISDSGIARHLADNLIRMRGREPT
jgi:hypothetical protein